MYVVKVFICACGLKNAPSRNHSPVQFRTISALIGNTDEVGVGNFVVGVTIENHFVEKKCSVKG